MRIQTSNIKYVLLSLLIALLMLQCETGIFKPEEPQADGFQGKIDTYTGTYAVLKPDHSLWMWGKNTRGILGNGTTVSSGIPIQVAIGNVVDFDFYSGAVVAADLNGDIWYWGQPAWYQVPVVLTPIKIAHIDEVIDIYVGLSTFTLGVLDKKGTIWSLNFQYPVEDPFSIWSEPYKEVTIPGAIQITDYLVLSEDGTLQGHSSFMGGTGNPAKGGLSQVIEDVNCFATIYGVQTVIGKEDGSVWHWGKTITLADGTQTSSAEPLTYPRLNNLVAVDVFGVSTIGVKNDGTVWHWGVTSPYLEQIPKIDNVVSAVLGLVGKGKFQAFMKQKDGTCWIFKFDTQELVPVMWD